MIYFKKIPAYTTEYITVTPKQKLLANKTICWFLYGNPNHMENFCKVMGKIIQEDIEKQTINLIIYGTTHPEAKQRQEVTHQGR